VQFNDGGSFGGSTEFTYTKSAGRIRVSSGSFTVAHVNTPSPKTQFSVTHDYADTTFEHQLNNSEGGGEILKYGTNSLDAGKVYFLHTDGGWLPGLADDILHGAYQIVGIALGTNPSSDGMLLKGYVRIVSTLINGTPQIGYPVYISDDAVGEYDFTRPAGSGEFVRIIGYCLDIHSSDILLYFNPDSTWVEIT
jgi:hypothetical protein